MQLLPSVYRQRRFSMSRVARKPVSSNKNIIVNRVIACIRVIGKVSSDKSADQTAPMDTQTG